MEQYGNLSTYNLESVLKQNIGNSDYYRNDCSSLTTWEAVIDAIYDQVDYLEPWLAGNARGPSTAFCLLHRLFVLKPTEEQVRATITHEDSVYIRAVSAAAVRTYFVSDCLSM
jgi:pre-mRNA-splicing factor 38B